MRVQSVGSTGLKKPPATAGLVVDSKEPLVIAMTAPLAERLTTIVLSKDISFAAKLMTNETIAVD